MIAMICAGLRLAAHRLRRAAFGGTAPVGLAGGWAGADGEGGGGGGGITAP